MCMANLHAIDLVAHEGAGQYVDTNILRFDVAGCLINLAVEIGYLDPAARGTNGTQRCVLAEQRQDM
jgi:hypothetical protein